MKISEAMTRTVTVVSPDQTIAEAAKMMADCDSGVLPVGENGRIVGMITDRDIAIRAVGGGMPPDTAVRHVMTAEVLYCFEDEDIAHVVATMGEQQVRRLPVLSRDKQLVGIVSIGDLARRAGEEAAGRAMKDIAQPGGIHNQSSTLH